MSINLFFKAESDLSIKNYLALNQFFIKILVSQATAELEYNYNYFYYLIFLLKLRDLRK
jgi:hypothetical protein